MCVYVCVCVCVYVCERERERERDPYTADPRATLSTGQKEAAVAFRILRM